MARKGRMKLKKKRILKKVIMLFIIAFSFYVGYCSFLTVKLYSSNEEFIMNLLYDANHYKKYEQKNIITEVAQIVYNVDVKRPMSLLENLFGYKSFGQDEEYNPDELIAVSNHIKDPNPNKPDNPIVYIYNSHQLENYSSSNYEVYNITPNVMMASYLLKEKLNNLGISSIVEEADMTEFMRINNWNYDYSYAASRFFINAVREEYSTLKYFIDIHRDSINKATSTVKINDKIYARVLFVVGMEYSTYRQNLELSNLINGRLETEYKGISRGVLTKKGADVNGVYNQDISPNSILIEIGGYENKIEEVLNTVEALSMILSEVINERG